MARPLRIEYPGAVYHIVHRGNDRRRVFHGRRYYELFLEKLEVFAEKFDVEVRCYCLMTNHIHLQVRTRQANLGRFMQSFMTSFTIVSNRWRRTSGHVFQGRYKAWVVEDEKYGSILSRYIHLNPVRVAKFDEASSEERIEALHAYKWSSFPSLTGAVPVPSWLDSAATWCRWGTNEVEQVTNYRHYVEEGLGVSLASPLEDAVAGAILGDQLFVEKIRGMKISAGLVQQDQPGLRQLTGSFTPEQVLAATAAVLELDQTRLTARRGSHRDARRMAIYCVDRFCRAAYPQIRLAKQFGISLSAFSAARQKAAEQLATGGESATQLSLIAEYLQSD